MRAKKEEREGLQQRNPPPPHLQPVGDQGKGQQQNQALDPHEEELYCEIGDPDSPQNLPEPQRLDGRAEEDEAAKST